MKEKKLINVQEEYMAQNVVDFLRSEDIDAYYMAEGLGEICQVIGGHSISGYNVYVRDKDYENAKEAVKYFE
ncbi:MAG: DUF2007 domain-containing protein [Clostridiales bacterium]|nr:DUF2007 domain-containing protein [Clostridiales bacterium]